MQVAETPELYNNKVLPYMQSLPASRIAWVYNMLEKRVSATGQALHAPNTLCCWLQKQHYNARQSVPGYQEQLDCSVCTHTCGMASTCTRLGGNAHFLTIYWQFAIIAAEPHKVRHVDIFTPTKHNVTGGDVNTHRPLTSALAA